MGTDQSAAERLAPEDQAVVRRFAELWWAERSIFFGQKWLGVPTLQHPFDAWITQEIVAEARPERIVECGSFCGGSAAMWALLAEQLVPEARVIAIDVEDRMRGARELDVFRRKVDFLRGSSIDPAIVAEVRRRCDGKRTLVILDSLHTQSHVAAELDAYAGLVTPGSWLIVQDGFVNGHPLEPDWGPGPWEAVDAFLARDARFVADRARERMLFTFNPRGFLRRRAD